MPDAIGAHRNLAGGAGHDADEFITTPARHGVVRKKLSLQLSGKLLEDFIAHRVSVGIVRRLKTVQIGHQQRKCLSALDASRQLLLEAAAVTQPGQRIDKRPALGSQRSRVWYSTRFRKSVCEPIRGLHPPCAPRNWSARWHSR